MASSSPDPNEEESSEFSEEAGGDRAPAPQKTFLASPAQLPSKLQFVALGAPGPSGSIKQCFRTVKVARRVPTLPEKEKQGTSSADIVALESTERRGRARSRTLSKRHTCATCDKRFTSPGKLSQHMLSHTGELPFSCSLCDKRFNSKFKLARHNLIHSENRAFACTVCGKTFNRKDHLTNHVRVHDPLKNSYMCERPDCKKSYTSVLSYRKHAALHSAEEGNLQCMICDKTFTNQQDIIYHLKVHTGSRTVKAEADKKFTCDYCERRFFTAKDVRRHLVVHTGRRDFLCPFCTQKFGRKDHLVRHVKNAHPDQSWKSAAVGTSSDPPPEATSFEETFTSVKSDLAIWEAGSTVKSSTEVPTRIPSTEIIVEIPPDLDIKVEPIDIKIEPGSPRCQILPVVYELPEGFSENTSELPFIMTEVMPDPAQYEPSNVETFLVDPGEGTSGLSSQMLGLIEESESFGNDEGRSTQRLPAFTQAFQTAQSPKPPPQPPPHH